MKYEGEKERESVRERERESSGCGSVGRADNSNARGPWFQSSHWVTIISYIYLFAVNCIEKTRMKKKKPGIVH